MALLAALARRGSAFVRRSVCVATLLNLLSHTLFWIGFPSLPHSVGLVEAEGLIAAAEAVAYRLACPFPWWQALAMSAILNLASLVLGTEIARLLG